MKNLDRFKSIWKRGSAATDTSQSLVTELYRGLLKREPDPSGMLSNTRALKAGVTLGELAGRIITSDEFAKKQGYLRVPALQLPDLLQLHPQRYHRNDDGSSTFVARDDADFDWLEKAIHDHAYYDSFGVWSPTIDLDKRIIAAFVQGLGAKSCLELGCFTGTVLSLLHERGIEVTGVEISHLAFVLAFPAIKNRIRYGDLLALDLDGSHDAIVAMDILEHLNPLKLDLYLARISQLLSPDGYCLINSPMFGHDDVFGEVAPPYLAEWKSAGPGDFWRHLHCDAHGWPLHGHLIWASPDWWERRFEAHGLVRDRDIERRAHDCLGGFFDECAPGRKAFFLLRHLKNDKLSTDVAERVARALTRELSA